MELVKKWDSRGYVLGSDQINFKGTGEALLSKKKFQELILGK